MSHHLDSPIARKDVRLDITDLYVFRGQTGTVFVMNVCHSIAGNIPTPGYHPEGMYEFKVDLDGDAPNSYTRRDEDKWKAVKGFSLDFKVLAISDDKPGLGRLKKPVFERDGKLEDSGYSPTRFWEGREGGILIPFSQGRWEALKAIQGGIRELYRRLLELLGGNAAAAAALLDAFKPAQLSLPAAKTEAA